jgi:hypothetical protein
VWRRSDLFVIPDCRQRVRPEVAGPMTSSAASPESIFASRAVVYAASSD